ncbi:Leucine-rich repeat - like 10 [Theobroma cacao]|nr:Leucine-rich repeat - like 10 [Theobroma cacao]
MAFDIWLLTTPRKDLGNNKINDICPHWLGSLPQLQVLVLQSNQFHGSIHGIRSNRSFSKIQNFDLSNNFFTGPLPIKYIKNFKAMTNLTIDKSAISYIGVQAFNFSHFYSYSVEIAIKGQEVELEKIFIKVIGELKSLKGLNLSHNNLSGYIPTCMGNLISLEWLELSSNELVGKIPTQLTSLGSLAVLNLSQNQLIGLIPLGKQFNTFGNDSYVGNLGSCGFPLSKRCDDTEASVFHEEADFEFGFVWKATFMGYGSGLVLGISATNIMFTLGRPKWLVRMVEEASYELKRYLRGGRNLKAAIREDSIENGPC